MTGGYLPIEDHGAIGNLRTVVLVGRDGAVDWGCLPDLDSPSTFASILDRRLGGCFEIRLADGPPLGEQRYLPETNVLETTFAGPRGALVVTDLMWLHGSLDDGAGAAETEPAVVRILRAEGGAAEVAVRWAPRLDLGRARMQIEASSAGYVARGGGEATALVGLPDGSGEVVDAGVGPEVHGRFLLEQGEEVALVARWGDDLTPLGRDLARQRLDDTCAAWRSWVTKASATGPRGWAAHRSDLIVRSELALKLLTNADSGGIAAAATTSLPEEVGGVRNWDYRYSWIRDAALAAQALHALGHRADAHAFTTWAERSAREQGHREWGLRIVYGLHGQQDLHEEELGHLEGYRRSAPVRVGNGAADQLQLDVYGELISVAYELVRLGEELEPDIRRFLPQLADEACRRWTEPDWGVWELRNGPFHLVYSKAMVWTALDRALRLARRGVIEGDVQLWRRNRAMVRDEVLARGYDTDLGSFAQAYDRPVLDASNLLLSMMELLEPDDPRVLATIDRTLEDLTTDGLVHRYRADDGIAGGEGAFGLCTFWLADALALAGRVDEAEEVYEGMADRANHVGLYAEQIDPESGGFLGNFPQAFSNIGLINSSLYLAHAQGRELPVPDLIGSAGHRQESPPD
jgi:GH15 family glucan-1,4-alpha-glucosidase